MFENSKRGDLRHIDPNMPVEQKMIDSLHKKHDAQLSVIHDLLNRKLIQDSDATALKKKPEDRKFISNIFIATLLHEQKYTLEQLLKLDSTARLQLLKDQQKKIDPTKSNEYLGMLQTDYYKKLTEIGRKLNTFEGKYRTDPKQLSSAQKIIKEIADESNRIAGKLLDDAEMTFLSEESLAKAQEVLDRLVESVESKLQSKDQELQAAIKSNPPQMKDSDVGSIHLKR